MDYLSNDLSDTSNRLLSWLFPLTYLLHIAEEFWADFPLRLLRTQGIQLSSTRFLVLQSLGLLLMTLGIVLSQKLKFANLMLVMLATVMSGNSLIHIGRSILFGGYEPGLLTSLLFWLPLGTVTLFRAWRRMNVCRYVVGICIGIVICASVEIITTSRLS